MKQHRSIKRAISMGLAAGLMACQPGFNPLSHTPKPLPQPVSGPFNIKFTPDCDGFPYDSENACYDSGGTPQYGNSGIPGSENYCKTYVGCELENANDDCYELEVINDDGESITLPCSDDVPKRIRPDAAPFDLFVNSEYSNSEDVPSIPDDSEDEQATLSPSDGNDIFDNVYIEVFDNEEKGWELEILKPGGKQIYSDNGEGYYDFDWSSDNLKDGLYTVRLTSNDGQVLERNLRVDNKNPKIKNLKVKPDVQNDMLQVTAVLEDPGVHASGISPHGLRIKLDSNELQLQNQRFEPETGKWSIDIIGYQAYLDAKANSAQGFEYPFELEVHDHAWNTTSMCDTGTDGPLRLRVNNKYFSPNGDGVKDTVQVEVIDDEGRDWELAVKRKGKAHKVWMGNGSTFINWDGKSGGTEALPEGKYEFVINTVKKRDRVRDREQVVLDVTPPEVKYVQTKLPNGRSIMEITMEDLLSGLDIESIKTPQQSSQIIPQKEVVKKNKKKATFRFEIVPSSDNETDENEANNMTTSALREFTILQNSPAQNNEITEETGSFDQSGNKNFILAKIKIPYKPKGDPKTLPCLGEGAKQGLVKVFDFDKSGRFNLLVDDNGERFDQNYRDSDTYTITERTIRLFSNPDLGSITDKNAKKSAKNLKKMISEIRKFNKQSGIKLRSDQISKLDPRNRNYIRERERIDALSEELYMLTAIDTHGFYDKISGNGKEAHIRIEYENGYFTELALSLDKNHIWTVRCL